MVERLGAELVARCQLWLWNAKDALPVKEPVPSRDVADRLHRHACEILDALEAAIGVNPFLAGEAPTIADCTAFAILQTARERFGQPLGAGRPRLDAWYQRFRARPSADY